MIVTGGRSGIGAATVRSCLDAGLEVISLDVVPTGETSTPHPHVHELSIDVRDHDACVEAVRSFPAATDLVNAAAIRPTGSITHVSAEAWSDCLEVNLTGVFHMMRAAVKHLPHLKSITNVASAAAYGKQDLAAYSASKAGLIALTTCTALDLASRSVRVNAVIPGTTRTALLPGGMRPEGGRIVANRNVSGIVLEPADVAAAITELVVGRALTTGAVIPVGILPAQW